MVDVPAENLLPKILGRLGKGKPSKRRRKGTFVQRKFGAPTSVLVRFLNATYKRQVKTSASMLAPCVRDSTAVWTSGTQPSLE